MVEKNFGVLRIAADRGQGLVQFVTDACRHSTQHRELAGLDQLILGAHQFLLRLLTLQYLVFESTVEAFQVSGAFNYALFQLLARMGLEIDAVHIVTSALHDQAQQQHQHQQASTTDGNHGVDRAIDEGSRCKNAHLPARFFDGLGLDQPRLGNKVQWLRGLSRVGLDGGDGFAFGISKRPGGTKAPVGTRGKDHHAVMVGEQQLLRCLAPQGFGVVQVYLNHQGADDFFAVAHRSGEEIPTFG
ncbi:hypothetical protein D3C77_418300 [compost metagenome]